MVIQEEVFLGIHSLAALAEVFTFSQKAPEHLQAKVITLTSLALSHRVDSCARFSVRMFIIRIEYSNFGILRTFQDIARRASYLHLATTQFDVFIWVPIYNYAPRMTSEAVSTVFSL